MADTYFEVDLAGLNELMKSAEMQSALKEAGAAVVSAAGGDYNTETYVLNFVAVQNVWPASLKAWKDNRDNDTLVKAAGATGLRME